MFTCCLQSAWCEEMYRVLFSQDVLLVLFTCPCRVRGVRGCARRRSGVSVRPRVLRSVCGTADLHGRPWSGG